MTETRKILVLGNSVRLRGVESYSWLELPEWLNVADFHTVVLDFTGCDEIERPVSHLPRADDFARLIFSEGSRIAAIGNPSASLQVETHDLRFGRGPTVVSRGVTWWLPATLAARDARGDSIKVVNERWQFWFEALRQYEWHFLGQPSWEPYMTDALSAAVPWAKAALVMADPLAETRTGDPLAVRFNVVAIGEPQGRYEEPRTYEAPAYLVWLPTPTEVTGDERVAMLLRMVDGVGAELPPPGWIEEFKLPNQVQAEIVVGEAIRRVADATAELEAAETSLLLESRFGKLLYEQGKEVLEPIVREALVALGAEVQPPTREGMEDGRLTMPAGMRGMLEIKGKRGQLKVDDVRQLDDWMRTALAEEDWDGKGIVVANLKLEERPDERADVIAPQALRFAERTEIAVVLTSQLHAALTAVQEGRFDSDAFWNSVATASGLMKWP